jgi:hypothetical protein
MYLTPGHRPGKIHADLQPACIKAHHKDSIIRMAESQTHLSSATLQRLKAVCILPQGIVLGISGHRPRKIKGHHQGIKSPAPEA